MRSFVFLLSALTLALTTLLPVAAMAADPAKAPAAAQQAGPDIDSIAPLKEFQDRTQARLEYMGSKYGLDIWMATKDTDLQIIYTTADKKALLLDGVLYSPGPTDETALIQRDFIFNNPDKVEDIMQKVGASRLALLNQSDKDRTSLSATAKNAAAKSAPARPNRSEALWIQLARTRTIDFGPQDTTATAFMLVDPRCEYCHSLWNKIEGELNNHPVKLRLVPVAILGKSSEEAVAQLLSQDNLQDSWTTLVKKESLHKPTHADGTAAAALNQKILTDYKLNTTPVLIYRQHGNGKVRLIAGDFPDTDRFFADAVPQAGTGKDETVQDKAPATATDTPQKAEQSNKK